MFLAACLAPLFAFSGSFQVPPEQALRAFAESLVGEHAYEMRMFGNKIGWAVETDRIEELDGRPTLLHQSRSKMVVGSSDGASRTFSRSRDWFALEGDGELLLREKWEVEDGKETVTRVQRTPTGWTAEVTASGAERRWEVPEVKQTLGNRRDSLAWLNAPRRRGEQFHAVAFDLDHPDPNRPEVTTFLSVSNELVGGKPVQLFEVEVAMDGIELHVWTTSLGHFQRGQAAGVLEFEAGVPESVTDFEATGFDLFQSTMVVVDGTLGNPATVERVVLAIEGPEDFHLPVSRRQEVENTGPGTWKVTLRRGRDWGDPAPLEEAERVASVRSDHRYLCEDPRVSGTARRIAGDSESAVAISGRLQSWVFRNLRGVLNDNSDNAVQVLECQAGDCTEHALLFVAFARSLGIPAREVGGLIYFDRGDGPRMGWHAWAEIHDGRQWVGVDPAWNEVRLSPTRLKVSEDPFDGSWTKALGKLSVRVVEVERR